MVTCFRLYYWFKNGNVSEIQASELDSMRQNLMITILFFTIPFNDEIDDKYEICIANKERTDVAFILER